MVTAVIIGASELAVSFVIILALGLGVFAGWLMKGAHDAS